MLYYFVNKTFCKIQNYRTEEQISGCQGLGGRGRVSLQMNKMKDFEGMMEVFCILIVVEAIGLYMFVKFIELNTKSVNF